MNVGVISGILYNNSITNLKEILSMRKLKFIFDHVFVLTMLCLMLSFTVLIVSPFAMRLAVRITQRIYPEASTAAVTEEAANAETETGLAASITTSEEFKSSEERISALLQGYYEQLATLDENKWGLLYYFDEYHVRCETTGEFCETEDADPMRVDITLEMHEGKYNDDAGSFLIFDVTNPALADAKIESYRTNGTYAISLKGDNDKDWNDTFEVTCTNALTFKCEKYGLDDDIASMLCRNNSVDVELYSLNAKSGQSVLFFTIPCSDFTGVWERYKDTLTIEE